MERDRQCLKGDLCTLVMSKACKRREEVIMRDRTSDTSMEICTKQRRQKKNVSGPRMIEVLSSQKVVTTRSILSPIEIRGPAARRDSGARDVPVASPRSPGHF